MRMSLSCLSINTRKLCRIKYNSYRYSLTKCVVFICTLTIRIIGDRRTTEMMVLRPLLCTLFRLNWAKQTPGIIMTTLMTKLAPEWVRTSDPVIRNPARYRAEQRTYVLHSTCTSFIRSTSIRRS